MVGDTMDGLPDGSRRSAEPLLMTEPEWGVGLGSRVERAAQRDVQVYGRKRVPNEGVAKKMMSKEEEAEMKIYRWHRRRANPEQFCSLSQNVA